MNTIIRESLGNCAILKMNRPAVLNAITTELLDRLDEELDLVEEDNSRAVILTGTGRGFCPGTDLKEPPTDIKSRIDHVHALVERLVNFPKLSVAAINGLAVGGGLELALACSFRVAVSDAKLALPEIKIGLMPSYGGTVLLPRLIGAARAEEIMLSGESITAEQGQSIGLINRICSTPAEVVQLAHDFIQPMCTKSLVPQRAIRRAIREAGNLPLKQALAHEFKIMEPMAKSEDCVEGVMSFIEKREPNWKDC
ncbi:MAG: enoyl-CoA hydratase/isomerase family protein [Halioglobus sp.]